MDSFYDFSKSNAFNENLIRMKFILHKISLQMSILSSSKTSWMFFNLHSKMTLLDFQLIIIITVTIQVAVFNRFSWNSHGWCESTLGWILFFLETIGPIEPLISGKMCHQYWFLGFYSASMGFFEEKFSKPYSVSHFS